MSGHMKRHHTNTSSSTQILYVIDHGALYAIPKAVAKKYIVETKKAVYRESNVPAGEVLREMDEEYGRAGALLKGLRAREGLSQVEFAKRINVSQANLSKMENGTRSIGKTIAKRISEEFSVNYRYFIE